MTDLTKMSADELRSIQGEAITLIQVTLTEVNVEVSLDAFDEMARRLREQEQQRDYFEGAWNRALETGKELIKAEKTRADQAESALLAFQVREAELREAALEFLSAVSYAGWDSYYNGGPDGVDTLFKKLEQVVSRSTGSKITADEHD